jgi:membrane-associated protease RseP (regulator of RpoE activity)
MLPKLATPRVPLRRLLLAGGALITLALAGPAAAQTPDDVLKELMDEHLRILQELSGIRANPGGLTPGGPAPRAFPRPNSGARPESRLGVGVSKPGPTLVEQLDLPRGQGLTLEEVRPDSAAARAGMKPHDILLEIDGKPVSNEPADFARQLAAIPAGKEVEALVLRRGKRESLKGLKLPQARQARPGVRLGVNGFDTLPDLPGGFGALGGIFPDVRAFGVDPLAAGGGGMTTIIRNGDRYTARYQESGLTVTVTGKSGGARAAVGEIEVQTGGQSHRYASLDDVPEAYRERAKRLAERAMRGKAQRPTIDFDHEI